MRRIDALNPTDDEQDNSDPLFFYKCFNKLLVLNFVTPFSLFLIGNCLFGRCNFMNFSRNIRCLECKAEGPKRVAVDEVEMKKGDWNCPQ